MRAASQDRACPVRKTGFHFSGTCADAKNLCEIMLQPRFSVIEPAPCSRDTDVGQSDDQKGRKGESSKSAGAKESAGEDCRCEACCAEAHEGGQNYGCEDDCCQDR